MTTTLVNAYRGLSAPATHGAAGDTAATFFGRLVERMGDWFMEQRRFRQTMNELSALSDRELDDIGLRRSEIHNVAQRCAYRR